MRSMLALLVLASAIAIYGVTTSVHDVAPKKILSCIVFSKNRACQLGISLLCTMYMYVTVSMQYVTNTLHVVV